eukprot:scaffold23940_cov112-Isochrysis_galbana.AAC.1
MPAPAGPHSSTGDPGGGTLNQGHPRRRSTHTLRTSRRRDPLQMHARVAWGAAGSVCARMGGRNWGGRTIGHNVRRLEDEQCDGGSPRWRERPSEQCHDGCRGAEEKQLERDHSHHRTLQQRVWKVDHVPAVGSGRKREERVGEEQAHHTNRGTKAGAAASAKLHRDGAGRCPHSSLSLHSPE